MAQESPQFLQPKKKPVYWDWWRENPVEIILVIFIITLFAFTPWANFGISPQEIEPAEISVVP